METRVINPCRQMEFGVQAIFGPSDPILGAHIQSICEALDVPHLEARIDFEPLSKELSINLHPSQEHMNKAFKDLMAFLNWTKVAIIYEEDYETQTLMGVIVNFGKDVPNQCLVYMFYFPLHLVAYRSSNLNPEVISDDAKVFSVHKRIQDTKEFDGSEIIIGKL
ncbi:hypothetical protein NQ315_000766 [Exocentrus adspersus]|uniref:Receptor ligand binding region domain-containing protein n=1 Tax=Exocentrus adspersus TaxID=1586481 RepID=A0AAV8WDU4_9CUCU|nr:hypothetical protein NQ315_000766 [Exocentrus adspersus]